jgi:hypothetical protein
MGIFGNFFGGSKKDESTSSTGGGRGSITMADVEKPGDRVNHYTSKNIDLNNHYNATTHNEGSRSSNYIETRDTAAAARASGDAAAIAAAQPEVIVGAAPEGIKDLMGYTNPVGIMGKLAGWVNGLDPTTQKHSVIGGRQLYKNKETDFTYSYNFLGLPYEVKIRPDGSVVDALKIDASGKVPGDMGYNKETNGYAIQARKAEANGDNDTARQIRQEEIENSTTGGSGSGSSMELNADNVLAWAKKAGVFDSNEDLKAITDDPAGYLKGKGLNLADIVDENGILIDPEDPSAILDPNNPNYALGETPTLDATLMTDAAEVVAPDAAAPVNYEASTATDLMGTDATTINAATGEIDSDTTIDAEQIDMVGAATGINADGTTSVVGNALNDFAFQDISKIIDTSTVAGKLLAQKLGEGNYTDSKSTILGQMEIISAEFKNSNGEPIIPPWAQSLSRDVSRTMAFSGITGTAQTAAMSNAIMEAVLGVAEKEASFFQTITIKNLDNKQQAIINKASVLANFETANLDARQEAAVQNARNFLEMDLANLTNEQQAEVLNTQLMMDAIFNDQAAINAARIFGAENANEFQKFYDTMSVQVQTHNSEQINIMKRFNAGEINDASEFNARMQDSRDQFYANMQFNVDTANAKWRQEVLTTNSEMLFDAYSADIKNSMDINQEGLNRLWDRVDSLLDYMFKGAQTEATLEAQILGAEIAGASRSSSSSSGIWNAIGQIGAAYISK